MLFPILHNSEELSRLFEEIGFMPFFANEIPGFSVEDADVTDMISIQDMKTAWRQGKTSKSWIIFRSTEDVCQRSSRLLEITAKAEIQDLKQS